MECDGNGLLLGASDAAKSLGVSRKTLYNHTAPRGDLPAVRIGARVLYDVADLRAWIERRKTRPEASMAEGGAT